MGRSRHLAGGRQAKRSFRTKKEAHAAVTELLAAHRSGTFVAPNRMPLRDFVEPWLAALENQARKPTTLRCHRTALDAYVLPRLGDVALQELRASDLHTLYAELLRSGGRRGQGLSMTTVHHVHAVMNKVLHHAERKGLVIRNVAKLANAPSLTTARAGQGDADGRRLLRRSACQSEPQPSATVDAPR